MTRSEQHRNCSPGTTARVTAYALVLAIAFLLAFATAPGAQAQTFRSSIPLPAGRTDRTRRSA